jgi:hypothetical protein
MAGNRQTASKNKQITPEFKGELDETAARMIDAVLDRLGSDSTRKGDLSITHKNGLGISYYNGDDDTCGLFLTRVAEGWELHGYLDAVKGKSTERLAVELSADEMDFDPKVLYPLKKGDATTEKAAIETLRNFAGAYSSQANRMLLECGEKRGSESGPRLEHQIVVDSLFYKDGLFADASSSGSNDPQTALGDMNSYLEQMSATPRRYSGGGSLGELTTSMTVR